MTEEMKISLRSVIVKDVKEMLLALNWLIGGESDDDELKNLEAIQKNLRKAFETINEVGMIEDVKRAKEMLGIVEQS